MSGSVIRIASGEGPGAIVEGFTIQNGSGSAPAAYSTFSIRGGVYIGPNSHAIVRGNLIQQNEGSTGPRVAVERGQALVENNEISFNLGTGEAVFVWENTGGTTFIQGNEIHSHAVVLHAIQVRFATSVEVNDNVIRDNAGDGISGFQANVITISGNTFSNCGQIGIHMWQPDDLPSPQASCLVAENKGCSSGIATP